METVNATELDNIIQTISFELPDLKDALKRTTVIALYGVVVAYAGDLVLRSTVTKLMARRVAKSKPTQFIDTTATEG